MEGYRNELNSDFKKKFSKLDPRLRKSLVKMNAFLHLLEIEYADGDNSDLKFILEVLKRCTDEIGEISKDYSEPKV